MVEREGEGEGLLPGRSFTGSNDIRALKKRPSLAAPTNR
jgi:hypothetical protein